MKKLFFLIICILFCYSCSFQPNNSDGIILMKQANDTLVISLIDSYYVIKEYEVVKRKDTLLIEIQSVYSPNALDATSPTLIPINSNINYIKLQNDSIINVIDIPFVKKW